MERNEKAVALLERAQELMNDEGRHWIKGDYSRELPDGSIGYCSMGAIYEATEDIPATPLLRERDEISFAAIKALAETIQPGYAEKSLAAPSGIVVNFNDHQAESWSDIKRAFERTIKRLKKS